MTPKKYRDQNYMVQWDIEKEKLENILYKRDMS